MGCFVRGDKNSMGCYVRGDKNSKGCFSGVANLCGMFCPVWQKMTWDFCPGMFCLAPELTSLD